MTSALAKVTSADPVIASPNAALPKLVFVVLPQVPDWSPVPISSTLSAEYVLAIINSFLVCYILLHF